MEKSRICVDFNELLDSNTILMSKEDTKMDAAGNLVHFYEGMPICFMM